MGRILMGVWDCPYCKSTAIPGNLRECPNCGNPRGENVKFYLLNQVKVVNADEAEKINRNPDWLCAHCGCYNSDSIHECKSCGNPRDEGDVDYFQHHENLETAKNANSTSEGCNEERDTVTTNEDDFSNSFHQQETEENTETAFCKLTNVFSNGFDAVRDFVTPKVLIIFSAVILVILGIIALAVPKVEKMTVEQVLWEYSMKIEECRTVDESGWSLPSTATLQRTSREIHHYDKVIDYYETKSRQVSEKVLDHYETKTRQVSEEVLVGYEEVVVGHRDLGNGYFEEITRNEPIYRTEYRTETYEEPVYRTEYRTEYYEEPVYKDVPVYQTKYYYKIDKWFYDRTLNSSGFDKNTYWPEVELTDKERVSDKKSSYFVKVVDEEGEYQKISVEYDEWLEIEVDSVVTVKKWLWTSKIVFEES